MRGGKRVGAGRPRLHPEQLTAAVPKRTATVILELRKRPDHEKECHCELCEGWFWLHECPDLRLRWEARKHYTAYRDGKPVQTVNHIHDKPIDLNVSLSLGERMRVAMEEAEQRVRNR